ncbi:CoA-binding protein [Desulfonema ishimotonii]|uniref:CoA-binding protein n=1 Tax=Desulfonema ishimotonii TaxID=45657 RepID=A0A401FXC9_9BACT|nr:acetate--CoA ligase family protein [Desulfonema ishimotonii]GBC61583.1 CoA-binding protein [Desulfonema ishimotonii]
MEFFFNPKGIALIGATANPLKGGYAILKNLATGFKGGIYPVNPRYDEIDGIPCYPSVAQVPDPVDLAIVFVPGRIVPQVIRDCAGRGIRGVMIESGGFAESGADGKAMQADISEFARKAGIRLWGPNCMGLVDARQQHVFSFVSPTIWESLIPGDVSLIVQSGMLSGAFLIDSMTHGTMGVNKVCSVGNKMDVDECELLEYLVRDPSTKSVGLYLESVSDGRRFLEICRKSPKPVVMLKGGKSAKGAAAAMSHTASMAGDRKVISGALAQAGVTEAKDFHQMLDICRALASFPDVRTPGNGRVAILTYSGGAGIVASDFIDGMDIDLADLSPASTEMLRQVFPEWMPVSNPVDLWPAVEQNGAEKAYGAAVRAACADPNVDAIFMHCFAGGFALTTDMAPLAAAAEKAGKPLFCWLIGKSEEARRFQTETQAVGIPVFREVYRAVECINAVFARKQVLERQRAAGKTAADPAEPAGEPLRLPESGDGVLDEYASKQVLAGCGIPVVAEEIADTAGAAAGIAARFGFPVVMKGLAPGQVHKTESGLVRLGISSATAAEAAFKALTDAMKGEGSVLVQPQVCGEAELIAGLVRDPQFGPCVMFGLGGVMAEVLDDVVFAVAPLTHADALELIGRLKAQKLLNGFRGAPPADREMLARILVRLGRLGNDYPRIREVDINPLMVAGGKPVAVDASVILSA